MLDQLTPPASNSGEVLLGLSKAAPPLTISALSVAGISLQDWVLIATLVYTVMQIGHMVWKFVRRRLAGDVVADDENG